MEPLFARVLIERAKLKTSNIIIPNTAEKRNAPCWGKLIKAGPTCDEKIKSLVGRTVMFGQHAGAWIEGPNKEEFYICQEEDLLTVE